MLEESRRKSEQLLRAAIDAIPEGFAYFDADDRLAIFNQKMAEIYPRISDVFRIGTPYNVFLRAGVEKGQYFEVGRSKEEFFKERLAYHRDPKGAIEFHLPNGRCIRLEEKKTPEGGRVGIRTDVTEEKKAEEKRLRQYQKMEVLGQLTSSVAHDFNNVLTVLDCNIGLLNSQNGTQKQQHSLINDCLEAVEMGASLTKRLTKFARGAPAAKTRVDLNLLIAGFSDLLARSVGKDNTIAVMLPDNPLPVLADAAFVEVALLNLVVNARDAMPEGGMITVSLSKTSIDEKTGSLYGNVEPGPYALLQVSDTGIGMAPEIKDRVFEAFFTTKDEGKGTGLGLSTVQDLVRSSSGFVQVESEPGKGTTVKVFLPLYEEQSP
jgi:signal transduction histidine kinase